MSSTRTSYNTMLSVRSNLVRGQDHGVMLVDAREPGEVYCGVVSIKLFPRILRMILYSKFDEYGKWKHENLSCSDPESWPILEDNLPDEDEEGEEGGEDWDNASTAEEIHDAIDAILLAAICDGPLSHGSNARPEPFRFLLSFVE